MRKIKADDYFNNGMFEMARFGKHVTIKNTMTKNQHQEYIKKLKENYTDLKEKIDELVFTIRTKVTQCNPVELLTFSTNMGLMSQLGKYSEIQSSLDDIILVRMTEYIQSILVSSSSNYIDASKDYDPSQEFFSIQSDITELYHLINQFYMSYGVTLKDRHPEWDEKLIMSVVESQILFNVRGQRYQTFEIEYLERLLSFQNNIFQQLFNMDASSIIEGIKKLQYSLSQGKPDTFNKFGELFDEFCEIEDIDEKKYVEEHYKDGEEFFNKVFGTKLYDVIDITGWNDKFVKELSYGLNEEQRFFNGSEFAGWPIIDMPIQKRPFIMLNNKYYCFDYYSFMDNIYRSIQKTVTRLVPNYSWADHQQDASEKMVEEVFKQLLPGCLTYRGNYYPKDKSKKQLAENDLLIIYSEIIIIAEVKAGSFVYTAPFTDFEAHITSYKTLIEKADWQCKRTFDYLTSIDKPIIYNNSGIVKDKIDMSTIKDIFMMSITVDNINDFAAKAGKLNFLELQCNAISIAIDDLMVYREYFESPLTFLHFLKQRKLAAQEEKIALNDELDHLGMYIRHNCYTIYAREASADFHMLYYGYREDLDKFFSSLYHPQLHIEKPQQDFPHLFSQIVNYLETKKEKNRVEISSYLLDFSSEAKEELFNQVMYALKRQLETKHMVVINASGTGNSLRYCCFVNQPGINLLSYEEKREHVLGSLIWNQETERVLIDLYFDEKQLFNKIEFNHFAVNDILPDEVENLKIKGQELAKFRMDKYKSSHSGKIGRNQLCPCNSGKKYKKCCGKDS